SATAQPHASATRDVRSKRTTSHNATAQSKNPNAVAGTMREPFGRRRVTVSTPVAQPTKTVSAAIAVSAATGAASACPARRFTILATKRAVRSGAAVRVESLARSAFERCDTSRTGSSRARPVLRARGHQHAHLFREQLRPEIRDALEECVGYF